MKRTTRIWLTAALLALLLIVGFVACTEIPEMPGTEKDSATETTPGEETPGATDEPTSALPPEGSDETPTGEATEIPTEEVTEEITEGETAYVVDFDVLDEKVLQGLFTGANQTTVSVATDEGGERYVSFTTNIAGATDPYATFDLRGFLKKAKMDNVNADDFRYIILKIRQKGCSTGTFDLYYFSGGVSGATGGMDVTAGFDVSSEDWQYILFDMKDANGWAGRVNGFRMDYMVSAVNEGENLQVAEIQFVNSADAFYKQHNIDWNDKGFDISDEDKAKAEELLNSTQKPTTGYDSYQKENAAQEDASLKLWFDHMYTRAPQSGFTAKADQILSGLGQMYVADERFKKNIDKYGKGTAEFASEAIAAFCKEK